ncbi:MAG: molybdate ABC transporter substrate-binding protein [Pseudomonadota bacterium]
MALAVAANFATTIEKLLRIYPNAQRSEISIARGSTGQLYAQIKQGAPYDLFFAADVQTPRRLIDDGLGLSASAFVYAVGVPVLYSPAGKFTVDALAKSTQHIAIANPNTSPYGRAAVEVLRASGLWPAMRARTALAANVGAAYTMVRSGAATLGVVALSQVLDAGEAPGAYRHLRGAQVTALPQMVVQLARAKHNDHAQALLQFIASRAAREVIQQSGYGVGVP